MNQQNNNQQRNMDEIQEDENDLPRKFILKQKASKHQADKDSLQIVRSRSKKIEDSPMVYLFLKYIKKFYDT